MFICTVVISLFHRFVLCACVFLFCFVDMFLIFFFFSIASKSNKCLAQQKCANGNYTEGETENQMICILVVHLNENWQTFPQGIHVNGNESFDGNNVSNLQFLSRTKKMWTIDWGVTIKMTVMNDHDDDNDRTMNLFHRNVCHVRNPAMVLPYFLPIQTMITASTANVMAVMISEMPDTSKSAMVNGVDRAPRSSTIGTGK